MDVIYTILSALSAGCGVIGPGISAGQWLVSYLRGWTKERKTAEVLHFLHQLGCVSEAEIRAMLDRWNPPTPVDASLKEDLAALLCNLVRGARFHTSQGTPLSSYLRCERLIEQLLGSLEPKRRVNESVALGRGDWKLERFLGMGAFGEVWVAHNPRFPVRRAFKFFTAPGGKDWLKREAEALFHIKQKLDDHPNVIGYHDIAVDATPYPFLMLEYVGGGSLEDWILMPRAEKKPIDVSELVAGVARGLAEAHRHKIYHRDLKPANILLTEDPAPEPKVADFGLSRVDEPAAAGVSSAVSQMVVVGTRMFLPPEAADPYEPRLAAQDDVFALGVIWYQALTGKIERPPYDFIDRLREAGADSRAVRLLSRCLAQPGRRFRDGGELKAALEAESAPAEWRVPEDGFDVGPLAREYLDGLTRT